MNDETMGNQQVTECELAWLAGIYDGEGCMSLVYKDYDKNQIAHGANLKVDVINTCPNLINKVVDILTKLGISHCIRERSVEGNWKLRYNVVISKFSSAKLLLERLMPYLVCKSGQAELLLRFINKRIGKGRGFPYTEDECEIFEEYQSKFARNRHPIDYTQDAQLNA